MLESLYKIDDATNPEPREIGREAFVGERRRQRCQGLLLEYGSNCQRVKRFSMDKERFQKYVTDTVGSVQDCYVAFVLDDGHPSLLQVLAQSYNGLGEGKYGIAHK